MFDKIESKSFTLTMLGTGTIYTPTLKDKKKAPVKLGDTVMEYYPKGETLSIVSTLIKTDDPVIDHKQLVPYQSLKVRVVNGPKNDGTNVGEKIGIGLGIALNALVRGQTELNEIGHSRGGVESILIAHEINAIKEAINSCQNFEQLIKELVRQQAERQKEKRYNTPDIIKPLFTQLPKDNVAQEQWFNELKRNIAKVSMSLFIIDPVPGDVWPVTWYDSRFFTIPPIVKYAEIVYYENEHSDWGFTPIYPEASDPENQVLIRNTLPGHHGTGSAGSNASQRSKVVSPENTKSTHVQKLMIFKLLRFLVNHGVEFKDAQEIFHERTGLGRKYIAFLDEIGIDNGVDVAKLDFPTIFRKLYDKIYANRAAYEAFNMTCYLAMGVAPQRKVLRTDHKYGLLTEIFPKNLGYVNEEHSFLMKEYFFKILQVDSHEDQTLADLIRSAKAVLSKNIRAITNLSSSVTEHSIAPAAILDSEDARKDVLSSFGTLLQRVSQQYLIDDWSKESKQIEKQDLFEAIIATFQEFNKLLEIDNTTIQEFVKALQILSSNVITQTAGQQHANLQDDFNRLQTPINANLQRFFNTLLTQINKDEDASNSEINPEIAAIFNSPDFAKLADHPIKIKIEYICQQLKDKLPQSEAEENLVDQLVIRFEEQYGSSFDEFEKLYHQIEVFIDDIAALGQVRELATEEAVFNKHELSLRKEAEALIDVAAQKFYRDRPNALPEPAEKGTFKELVERHAINKYGVVDRLKQEKAALEVEKKQLVADIQDTQQNLEEEKQKKTALEVEKKQLVAGIQDIQQNLEKEEQQKKNIATTLKTEQCKKIEYHTALNDEKEAEHLLLIKRKLIPLTAEYLASLKSELSGRPKKLEQDDEIKKADAKTQEKITEVAKLLKILKNEAEFPHPKDRAREFFNRLDIVEPILTKHRCPRSIRYIRNVVIAASILVVGLGLIALAAYNSVGYSSIKSFLFWQPLGQNVVSTLNEYRKELHVSIDNEVDDERTVRALDRKV
ncbi:hypothetical protein DGG96_03915 [Legionella qingyii]|uniref:Uncharacterized protein n=1 Tax=Legionella qingyii TaxID=2184757 RepID=A0A317U6H4_9GAMM|nr:hypothetical protein [Legionella qingyii]PWY56875.1 hypothetical protein DGG96_03915 [Legionella qingyii]RUR24482.1 hypothetical protein ELY20_05320 [Legionella qingyii]RUR27131.1 hypothetical protein ELY16_06095 [Legionella qingyii]